ncbi:hypothetical protein F5B22DRAFT_594496 [Xylaria bambusicola]|uniref:uncharacterized protein n=1 Tax=Xylaria bambusicola TaxID=326684 RepID=UPI0020079061|nr:uncharacterized protein F5B22DRAFT_594496 [Xylaria bambusicola]KAI0521884.1 hypothetical protein F5B22DRAFT_594496 [Xylaria bambusicola]
MFTPPGSAHFWWDFVFSNLNGVEIVSQPLAKVVCVSIPLFLLFALSVAGVEQVCLTSTNCRGCEWGSAAKTHKG